MKRVHKLLLSLATVLAAGIYAAAVNIPHTFTDGTTISASQVNQNFRALAHAIPGLANNRGGGPVFLSWRVEQVILQQSITVPTAGHVLAIASGISDIQHNNGTWSTVYHWISRGSPSFTPNQYSMHTVPASAPSAGGYSTPLALHDVFPVTAGTHTFYFVGHLWNGSNISVWAPELTLVFIPTSYGSVTSASLAAEGTLEEHARELENVASQLDAGAQSAEARLAQLEQELAEMHARLEALEGR